MGKSNSMNMLEGMMKYWKNSKNQRDPKVEKEIKDNFNQIDINHDGSISYQEFCKMMRNIIKK